MPSAVDMDIFSNEKVITFTDTGLIEDIEASLVALPTSKPGTPQGSVTLSTATHFPTVVPANTSVKWVCGLHILIKNDDASSQGIFYDIKVNGTTVREDSSSCAAGEWGTVNVYLYDNLVSGQDIDIYLHGGSANVKYQGFAFRIVPCNVIPSTKSKLLKDVTYTLSTVTASGFDEWIVNKGLYIYGDGAAGATYRLSQPATVGDNVIDYQSIDDTYGLFGCDYGSVYQVNGAYFADTSDSHWDIYVPLMVTKIKYREVKG